jgi:hypothetical protein
MPLRPAARGSPRRGTGTDRPDAHRSRGHGRGTLDLPRFGRHRG